MGVSVRDGAGEGAQGSALLPKRRARRPSWTLIWTPVRAENRIHGSDQQSCSPGAPPVMITGHVSAVHLPSHHTGDHVATAVPASADRGDLDLAPPARC